MRPLTVGSLYGVWGSVLLPIGTDDAIDQDRLAAELDALAASALHGVYAHGTAGEFHTLHEVEFDLVNETMAAACGRTGKPFQIGVSHPVAQAMLDRVARAARLAPSAFQVVLPDWQRPSERECETFLRRIADAAAPVPLVLYNPPHAKTQVAPAFAERLLDAVPNLVGLKVVGGDAGWYDAMREVLARCAVFVPGHRLATGIARGARGSYSNIAALTPDGAARWYATMESDPAAAADVERRIGKLFAEHITPLQQSGIGSPALDKFLATVGGWADIGLRVRWPYDSAPAGAVEAARRTVRDLLPELVDP